MNNDDKKYNWQHQTHLKARYLFNQLEEMLKSAPNEEERNKFLATQDNIYFRKLNELYTDDFQLSALIDNSDIIFHADGENIHHGQPSLSAVNHLTKLAITNFKKLAGSYLSKYLTEKEVSKTSHHVDFRFNGYAPGSVYMGFSVAPLDSKFDFYAADDYVIPEIRKLITSLSLIPQYLNESKVNKYALNEIFSDPAMRDTALQVCYAISPNGNNGIDELEITNSDRDKGLYNQKTKRLFKDAISNPLADKTKFGKFYGEIRQIDVDKKRFELRNVKGIGNIRCIKPGNYPANKLIEEFVEVTGEYEEDKNGKPSLLRVTEIKIKTPKQKDINY